MGGWKFSRRALNRLMVAGSAAYALRATTAAGFEPKDAGSIDDLAESFANPPGSAAPHTFWMWMNGNITREGITLDLEAMPG